MDNWEEFDKLVKEETIDSEVKSGVLLAKIVSLYHKKLINKKSTCEEIQQILLARYDVEYKLLDIENELICLNAPEKDIIEIEEDFYPGY